ncbi:uncharacterized protein LOC130797475 isoform X2 [Amaranthus tricolor]|uniref:uncharacterized protein LOC130797475 isoform X2 n=1 Tax=Amaranthus tricolor TaxID=29722 RepID=UPI002582F85B|nr:uncharacterized protein LOC130797475 isoform X2 [Amaranthus tricolor]
MDHSWRPNPIQGDFGTVNRGPYPMKNHGSGYGDGGYMWNDYSNVNNRSSKRLRVDGNDCGPYGPNGVARVSSNFHVEDNEKRLKSVHDQGVFNPGFGFGGDVRGYASGSSGFDWNFDGWHHGNSSNCGLRPPGNVEMRNSLGTGHNVHFGSQFVMNRSASNVEQDVLGNQYQQQAQYGQVENPSDPSRFYQGGVGHDINGQGHGYHYSNYGNSHGLKEMYSGNVDSMHPNNAPMHNDHRNNMPSLNHYPNNHSPLPSTGQQPGRLRYDYGSQHQISDVHPPPVDGYQVPTGNQNVSTQAHYGVSNMNYQGGYGNSNSDKMAHMHASLGYDVQPPLPTSPPPPLPREPPVSWPVEQKPLSSPLIVSSSLFPVHADSSAAVLPAQVPIPESHSRAAPLLLSSQTGHTTRGAFQGDPQGTSTLIRQYVGDGQSRLPKNNFADKPKIIDAAHLFKPPHRASRPDHFVIILRGLPGSGKSYLAKMLRDLEVEHGGKAPRIHSMDDYFMTEVEKVDEKEASKSLVRFKKPVMKVLEYSYEPEMEEAYRSSMLKAFKKTLEEGSFTFVIVDDRNLRVADFAQFWASAKRLGYEVYVLEAPYKDPTGCTARNIHGFTQVEVEKMAALWEEAPSLYLQVDVKSLFHGDDLKESNIEEVDMDTEDDNIDGGLNKLDESVTEKIVTASAGDLGQYVLQKDEWNFETQVHNSSEEVKDLGRSKWSGNLDDDDNERTEVLKGKANVLSGSVRTYGREGKSVHWGDQSGRTGFSIGAVKKANSGSLVIGPGPGYNLKSNPLLEEEAKTGKPGVMKKQHSMFKERLRAEQESFKAVFDRRRHRIGGLDADDD